MEADPDIARQFTEKQDMRSGHPGTRGSVYSREPRKIQDQGSKMNFERRLEKIEADMQKPVISSWADLMAYTGPWPAMVSDEMAPLFEALRGDI